MNHDKLGILQSTIHRYPKRFVLSLTALTTLTACPVDSTSVADENLIAKFLVQNDNGQVSTIVTFTSRDLGGTQDVDLVADESISYQNSEGRGELDKRGDGEYSATVSSAAADIYSFTLTRKSDDSTLFYREISDNHAYLPEPFQSVQTEPLQFGPSINLNWVAVDNSLQLVDGVVIEGIEESFITNATCQAGNESIEFAIADGSFVEQNGLTVLEIPVTEYLQQVSGLSAAVIAMTSCDFDVQLIRAANGVTDNLLSRRSTARGEVLRNIAIQWTGQ